MSIDKELFSDLADYLGTFAEAIKQAIPEPYAEVEANQIEDTLNQLTVAELTGTEEERPEMPADRDLKGWRYLPVTHRFFLDGVLQRETTRTQTVYLNSDGGAINFMGGRKRLAQLDPPVVEHHARTVKAVEP